MKKKNKTLIFPKASQIGLIIAVFLLVFAAMYYGYRPTFKSKSTVTSPVNDVTNQKSKTADDASSLSPTAIPSPSPTNTTDLYAPEQRWLNAQELKGYYDDMRLKSLTTSSMGRTFLAVDWNSNPDKRTVGRADNGRMVALGYENYQHQNIDRGGRWGAMNVIYSTYDFEIGTEYFTYAKKDDYDKLRSGEYKPDVVVNNVKGIVNYQIIPFFGSGQLAKNVVFPFENYYIVFTYYVVNSDTGLENLIRELRAGNYPQAYKTDLDIFDTFVNSATFQDQQF